MEHFAEKFKGFVEKDFVEKYKKENLLTITWEGEEYHFEGFQTQEELEKWFNEYLPKAPGCSTCHKPIFPGEPVGGLVVDGKNTLAHLSRECSGLGGAFAGLINNDGQLIPYPIPSQGSGF
jgi:hypothetical protein